MQSIIGTFIFFNWGLDMAGKLRMLECVGLGCMRVGRSGRL
jgi:uncharacterized membrane protein YeiB